MSDEVTPPNMPALIKSLYSASIPKSFYTHEHRKLDRSQYVTASEVGSCLRKIKFDKLVPVDEEALNDLDKWGYAERGNAVEAWFNDLLNQIDDDASIQVYYTGASQVSFTEGNRSGTPDGVVTLNGKAWVLDIKSIDPRTSKASLPKDAHYAQVMQNADLVRGVLGFDVAGAILLYVNCSNLADMLQFSYEIDYDEIDRTVRRADRVMSAKLPSELPAEGVNKTNGCKFCAHTKRCSEFVAQLEKEAETELAVSELIGEAERTLKHVFR